MEQPQLVTDEIYHVYNRGVEKRNIFMNEREHFRFIRSMYEFNDTKPALNMGWKFGKPLLKFDFNNNIQEKMVEILCFCLMPNHYHFLLRQLIDGGITEFMRKIGTGYTNYFNIVHDRVGPLFQGKFKAVHITEEPHLLYLPHYIHLNPLDLSMPEWRERNIRNVSDALKFLESYRWSSYADFIGKKNFPYIVQPTPFLQTYYGSSTSIIHYRDELADWLKSFDFFDSLQGVILE